MNMPAKGRDDIKEQRCGGIGHVFSILRAGCPQYKKTMHSP